jgi:eukaryotic-like serine/threonine-protein kinase
MSANPLSEDPRLLSVAAAISEGAAIDWEHAVPDSDRETTEVLDELRVIDGVSRMSDPIPDSWGPFAITGEIGHGSYGTVYRAFDPNLNLEVALKVIRPRGKSPLIDVSHTLNEARLLAQVNHPNVVRVYRAERIGQEIAVSMEFVRGRTLRQLVANQGPFSAREAMLIGVDLCCALAAVHGARLIHGDIKALNVMRAMGGRTVLMDFGSSYEVKAGSSGRRLAGTPVYLAPEVFAGEMRTTVSDIYSVGVLLFYLATGSYPLEGQTRADIARLHERHAPRRLLRDIRPDLPEAFIGVVDRAMAENPLERYQTAGELEAALNRALVSEEPVPVPVPVPVPGPAPRLPFWLKLSFVAATILVASGLAFNYFRLNSQPGSPRIGADAERVQVAAPASPEAAVGTPADAYRIEAAFYREQGGSRVRLQPGERVARGDKLSLQVIASVPTYVYVVNEDDHGESYLLFPLPGQQLANPLPPGTRHQIPGVVDGERVFWEVSSAGGREHFLIFATPQPLTPAFARVFEQLPKPSANKQALAQPLTEGLQVLLRGVGGLAKAPTAKPGAKLNEEFGAPLSNAEETARGVWVRQLTLENPKK